MNLVNDCIYHKFSKSKHNFFILYIDEILPASSNIKLLYDTKRFLAQNLEMKDLSDVSFILGIQIH